MTVEYMNALGVLLQGVGTLVGAIAVIVASYIGANTYAKWRRQKVAERRFELAERILVASYNAKRQLRYVRQAFLSNHELHAAELRLVSAGIPLPTDDRSRKRHVAVEVYNHRIQAAKDELLDLYACIPIARAIFGKKLEDALEMLGTQFNRIRTYLDIEIMVDPATHEVEFGQELRAALTSGYKVNGRNEFDDIIAEQFRIVEDICLPILRHGK